MLRGRMFALSPRLMEVKLLRYLYALEVVNPLKFVRIYACLLSFLFEAFSCSVLYVCLL